jgi:hypothetical protein
MGIPNIMFDAKQKSSYTKGMNKLDIKTHVTIWLGWQGSLMRQH